MSRPKLELPNLLLITASIRKTLVVPDWDSPWGPYYFQHLKLGQLSLYDQDSSRIDPRNWPSFGFMVSSEEFKKNKIIYDSITATTAKLDLFSTKLDKYHSSFSALYEYTLLIEQDTKRWQWAAVGESVVIVLLLTVLILL